MSSLKNITDKIIRAFAGHLSDLEADERIYVMPDQDRISYNLPTNYNQLPEIVKHAFDSFVSSSSRVPSLYLYKFKNVNIASSGVIFKNFKVSVPSLNSLDLKNNYLDTYLLKQWFAKHKYLPKKDVIAVVHNGESFNNYYHWLLESCPRLLLLREKFPNSPLLVPSPVPEYIKSSSAILGFDCLVPIEQNEVLKASNVILAQHCSDHQFFYFRHLNVKLISKLRNEILKGIGLQPCVPFRKVYVTRASQKFRRVLNEEEFIEVLDKYDFEVVSFENMSFVEQVKLLFETKVFIGAHGANLTNMVFMQPNTKVVEMSSENWISPAYFKLSTYINVLYYSLPCIPVSNGHISNSDLLVSIEYLKNFVKKNSL